MKKQNKNIHLVILVRYLHNEQLNNKKFFSCTDKKKHYQFFSVNLKKSGKQYIINI